MDTIRAQMAGQIASAIVGQWFEQHQELLLTGRLDSTAVIRQVIAEFAVTFADDVITELENDEAPPCP